MRKIFAAWLLIILVFAGCTYSGRGQQYGLELHFIDVGQGDSTLILCGGEAMLVDAGLEMYGDSVCKYLKNQGITQLDFALATHPHSDHIGAMAQVVTQYEPRVFLMPQAAHATVHFTDMLHAVESVGCSAEYVYAGMEYTLGDARITVLSPEENHGELSLNNASAVILIEYDGARVLLTGDAEGETERRLLGTDIPPVDILKLGHHGSSDATIPDFFGHLSPDIAVISCGAGNEYGHPHKEVLDTLGDTITYRTDINGNIVIAIEKGEIYAAVQNR